MRKVIAGILAVVAGLAFILVVGVLAPVPKYGGTYLHPLPSPARHTSQVMPNPDEVGQRR